MKAALLLRASTDAQDLESQRVVLLKQAEDFGYEVPEEYIFGQHITGRDDIRKGERESITKLKAACRKGDVSVILIFEVSRLSRSSIDGRSFVRDFNEMKIPIYFKDRGIWSLDRNTLEEDTNTTMIIGLFFDFAQQELKTLKSRTIRGRRNSASKGLVTGGYLNYGYKKDAETKKVVLDETEAPFVVEMFQKYATGEYSLGKLTKYANTLPYSTRYKKSSLKGTYGTASGLTKSTENLKWNASVIQGMLKNEIYTGKAFFQDVVKEVPALIDEVIFKKVQDKLATNPKYLEKSRNHTHLLQKKVLCGHCGNLMYGHIDADNKTGRYMCSSYHSSKVLCGNTTLGYDKFEAIIWNFIKNQSYIFQNLEQEEKDKLIANIANEKVSLISQITLKEGFIRQENNKISNLLDLVKASAGAFKMDDVIRDKIEIDKSIAEYENEIQKLRSSISLIDNRIEQIRSAEFSEESITKIEADRLQMKKVVNDVIDLITVYKIDNNSIVLQVAMYDYPVFNILVNQRSKRIFKYWYIEEHTANFLRGKYKPSIIPESDNFYFCNPTELAESTYWEYYAFEEMCSILEHSGLSSEYMPAIPFMNPKSVKPDVIPTDEEDFKEYMNFKFGTTFDYES